MKKIKLFDYQEDMKSRIEKALGLHRSVMVQMPTGTGKTILLASVVESFLREHSNCNVWIVAHRRELVSQIDETVRKFHSYYASNTSSLLKLHHKLQEISIATDLLHTFLLYISRQNPIFLLIRLPSSLSLSQLR